MNIMQSHSLISAGSYVPYTRPCSKPVRQQIKLRIMCSCKATDKFQKEVTGFSDFKNASVDQIKKSYRKMALRYHPDVCDPSNKEESTRMFIELQKAYKKSLLDQDSCGMSSNESKVKWDSQLSELKRRSELRKEQMEGSWGCRMRANC